MCIASKPSTVQREVIKQSVQADASVQKPTAENRNVKSAVQNIKTSSNGVDEDVLTSKKKLLGE